MLGWLWLLACGGTHAPVETPDDWRPHVQPHVQPAENPVVMPTTMEGSHCVAGEQLLFGCPLNDGRVMSLCASPELTLEKGWAQFRVGALGSAVSVPQQTVAPATIFALTRNLRVNAPITELAFSDNGIGYVVGESVNMELKTHEGSLTIVGATEGVNGAWTCASSPVGSLIALQSALPLK